MIAALRWFRRALRVRRFDIAGIEWTARYAERLGFPRSFIAQRSIDAKGRPLPWMTYPAIAYIHQLDLSACFVLEFGSGAGSLFWAERARRVVSVEHDAQWAAELESRRPPNLELRVAGKRDAYLAAFSALSELPDIVVIDGKYREECAALVAAAAPRLVIFDNSDRHPQACAIFADAGYQRVDFIGWGPINHYAWATSIFFRAAAPWPVNPAPIVLEGLHG